MQHRRGTAFFPLADAIVEPKQMSEALWVMESRPLALGALGKGERRAQIRTLLTPYHRAQARPLVQAKSAGSRRGEHRGREFLEPPSFYKTNP